MKNILIALTLLSVVAFQCDRDTQVRECDLPKCDPARATVKNVINQEGRIDYSQEENSWVIISTPQEITYDAQDIGIICGDLAEEFQKVGNKVKFSGEYKKKCGNNKGPFAGQTYYYLHISKIENLNNG